MLLITADKELKTEKIKTEPENRFSGKQLHRPDSTKRERDDKGGVVSERE